MGNALGVEADLPVESGARAVLEAVHSLGKESTGKFYNIRVNGWEENEGLNRNDDEFGTISAPNHHENHQHHPDAELPRPSRIEVRVVFEDIHVAIQCDAESTIKSLKEYAAAFYRIEADMIVMNMGGISFLAEEITLEEYGIQDGSEVEIVVKT
ncbi:MAG: hypothetical protein Q9170_004657 [Blastenia crenularia]